MNPTGRKDHFRGLDWVIEHNNLYIKRIFGGSGSNHTVDRMIDASPLIEVYKNVRKQFERMFCLIHKTGRHSAPKMERTFERLRKYMEYHKTNHFIAGRGSENLLSDIIQVGLTRLTSAVEQVRGKWVAKAKNQERLREQVKQSQSSPRRDKYRQDSPGDRDTVEEPESPDQDEADIPEEPENAEEEFESDEIADDGSLFVDNCFE